MSYFVCVSASCKTADFNDHFPSPLTTIDITATPAGRQIIGNRPSGRAVLVTHHGCSTDIIDRHGKARDITKKFRDGLEHLLSACGYATVLVHFFRGNVKEEALSIAGKIKIGRTRFLSQFPSRIDEDTKYAIVPDSESVEVAVASSEPERVRHEA
jgi:hypothetical protein